MVHVLHIVDNINVGGGQRIILDIIKNSNEKEFEMSIFCYESEIANNHFVDEINEHNIKIICINKKNPSISDYKKILKQCNPDVIHIHACTSLNLMICIYLLKSPALFSIHCNALLQAAETGASISNLFARLLLKIIPCKVTKNIKSIIKQLELNGKTSDNGLAVYKNSKLYANLRSKAGVDHLKIGSKLLYILFKKRRIVPVPVSKSVSQSMNTLYELPYDIVYIYNGIDTERFVQEQKADYKIKEPLRIINVARFSQWKNHELLIDSFALILKQLSAILILVGDGPERLRMLKKTITLGISESVKFMGNIKDVGKEMSISDIYVMCSMDEGFGIALTEAMVVGLPVVVTNTGGMPEQVVNGWNGKIVEPNDPRILADTIIQLSQNETDRINMGNEAKKNSELFHVNQMVLQFCDLYKNLKG